MIRDLLLDYIIAAEVAPLATERAPCDVCEGEGGSCVRCRGAGYLIVVTVEDPHADR